MLAVMDNGIVGGCSSYRMGRARRNPLPALSRKPTSIDRPCKSRRRLDPSGKTLACRKSPSISLRKNIPLYRNSELRYPSPIPARGEGRSYVVTNVGWGAVDAAAPARMWEQGGQRIEPNPVSSPQAVSYERRLYPAKPLGEAGSLRTAKPCGPGCRCYSQAFATMHRPNRARCIS
jgi:hypothetical protein